MPHVQLLRDPGCPHVDLARARLRAALLEVGAAPFWTEGEAAVAGRGSPTILIEGVDPWADDGGGPRCRVYGSEGAPTVDALVDALRPAAAATEASLVLVRHGETVGLSSVRLYGATDVALSDVGEAQMRRAGEALRGHRVDQIVASSLGRSTRGAAIVREALEPPPPLRVIDALRERDFGRWEGWTVEEVAARDPEGYRAWTTQGLEFVFPGGESRRALLGRVEAALADGAAFPVDGRSVAVLHKGIIKTVLSVLLKIHFVSVQRLPVALGSIHLLERVGGRWRLRASDLRGHLGELDLGG